MTVRVVRSASRLTQEEIARENNIDRSIVSNLEAGKIHRPDLIYRIIDRAGGEKMLDRLIEQIRHIREWFVAQQTSQLLYI